MVSVLSNGFNANSSSLAWQAIGVTQKTEKKLTISDKAKCRNCGKCAMVCPFQLKPYLEFSENNQFKNINCIKCATCVKNCPVGTLSITLSTAKEVGRIVKDISTNLLTLAVGYNTMV